MTYQVLLHRALMQVQLMVHGWLHLFNGLKVNGNKINLVLIAKCKIKFFCNCDDPAVAMCIRLKRFQMQMVEVYRLSDLYIAGAQVMLRARQEQLDTWILLMILRFCNPLPLSFLFSYYFSLVCL